MALTYSTTLKDTRMDDVTAALGSGSKIVIGTSALSGATGVLVTVPMDSTAPFGASSNGVITLDCTPALTAEATGDGTPAKAELRTSADVVVVSGLTVGVDTGDIQLGSASITTGLTVSITSGSITHG